MSCIHHRKKSAGSLPQRLRTHTLRIPAMSLRSSTQTWVFLPWSFEQCSLPPGSEEDYSSSACKACFTASSAVAVPRGITFQWWDCIPMTTSCLFSSFLTASLPHLLLKARVSEPEPCCCASHLLQSISHPRTTRVMDSPLDSAQQYLSPPYVMDMELTVESKLKN